MAHAMHANGRIADAVAQVNVLALGSAAAQGLASQYVVGAHASGLSLQNAAAHQRQGNVLGTAATTQAAMQLLTLGPSRAARLTKEVLGGHSLLSEVVSLTAAARRLRRSAPSPGAPPPGTHSARPEAFDLGPHEPPSDSPAPERSRTAAALGTLATAAENVAKAAKALADIWQGSRTMGEDQVTGDWTEAISRFRAALDQLAGVLGEVTGQLKESADADLRQRLQSAIQDLRNAAGQFRPVTPARTVPAGATQSGLVIVGSGNVSAGLPTHRIVGASY